MRGLSDKIDLTLVWLVVAIVIVFPLTLTQIINPKEKLPSDLAFNIMHKTSLWIDEAGVEIPLKRGEKVKVLGFVEGSHFYPHQVWVETEGGNRGFVNAENLDDKMIIYPKISLIKDSSDVAVRYSGQTVKVVGWEKSFSTYNVVLPDGANAKVEQDYLYPSFADMKKYKVDRGEGWRPMSEKKFQDLVATEPFSEVEKNLSPAVFISKQKDGSSKVIFPVRVFHAGKFYSPVMTYDEKGNPVDYAMGQAVRSDMNSLILSLLPFYGRVCDLPLVWNFWTKGVYDTGIHVRMDNWIKSERLSGGSVVWVTFVRVFFFWPLLIFFYLFTPMFLPMLLFGLMYFKCVSDRAGRSRMLKVIKVASIAFVLIWIIVSLPDYYFIYNLVAMAAAFWLFWRSVKKVFLMGEKDTCKEDENSVNLLD